MSTSRRASRAVAVVVAAFALGGCGASEPPPPAPAGTAQATQRVEVAYADGAVTGGVSRVAVPLGTTVELVVASDVADEVHLHGYDRSAFVTAGATATLRFVADLPGVFEVELEQSGEPVAQLEVS